jgi:putative ABC transport system permease protein
MVYASPLALASFRQDGRFALRSLRRTPFFTLLVVVTLAVGIGSSTAIFSIVDRLLFRGLPYPHADRLVSVGITGPIDTSEFMLGGSYFDWRARPTPFVSLTAMLPAAQCDLGDRNPLRIHCVSVESNFLPTLGVHPLLGRNFTSEEDRPDAPRAVLLGYPLWQARFAGSPRAVGQTLLIDDRPARIVGVLPASFEMPQLAEADVLLPAQIDETAARRPGATLFLRCFARLKDGISIKQARAEMQPLYRAALRDAPAALRGEIRFTLRSLRDRQIQDERLASWLLLATVVALLLLACGNVANLLLARGNSRQRELAMRAALGASRFRLIQLSLCESLFLGAIAAVVGVALAWAFLKLIVKISPHAFLRLDEAGIDMRVLAFAIVVSLAAALLFGAAAALRRPRPEALTGWHAVDAGHRVFRQLLVAFQVALSVVLLTGCSLFVRSLLKLEGQQLGMRPERVITASFVLPRSRYQAAAAQNSFYRRLESRLAAIPGVESFALSDTVPPAGAMHARPFSNMRIAGQPPLPEQGGLVAFRYVSPGYLDALQIDLSAGQPFHEEDRHATETPVILSAGLARKLFGARNPVGAEIALSGFQNERTVWSPIVGVAADVKNSGLARDPAPEYYRLRTWNADNLGRSAVAILRTSLPPEMIARQVRRQVASIEPGLPLTIQSLPARISELAARPRLIAVLLGSFASFGLLLASVGLYAVVSFLVTRKTREIGVRMALGANPSRIARQILTFALGWIALGLIAGLTASAFLSRLAGALLFEVSPQDPGAFIMSSVVLLVAALCAAALPSLRGARVDPAVSLRHD